jgi:catechol 2,3-dioxygenase-like lactoylglutathione lyase family enzyme
MAQPLANKKLAQVAFVTKDIEAMKAKWAALLGVEIPNTIVTSPGSECRMTTRGIPSDAMCKLAFFDLGGVQLELIEPIGDGASTWHEGLVEGEGFHHIAFWTENMAEVKETLEAHGAPLVQRGDMGSEGQYAYYDGQAELLTRIEVLENKRTEIV